MESTRKDEAACSRVPAGKAVLPDGGSQWLRLEPVVEWLAVCHTECGWSPSWLCLVHSEKWQPRTPAMAAGPTDHIWTFKKLLTVVLILRQAST